MPYVLPTIKEVPMKSSRPMSRSKILSTKAADAALDWIVFPLLLFVQFGATMYCQARQGVLELNWAIVLATISVFCIVAGIYRQVLRRHPSESLLFLLLPELFTNFLLAMVMFGDLGSAFEALVLLTVILGLVGGLASAHTSIIRKRTVPQDYQPLAGSEEEDNESEDEWIC